MKLPLLIILSLLSGLTFADWYLVEAGCIKLKNNATPEDQVGMVCSDQQCSIQSFSKDGVNSKIATYSDNTRSFFIDSLPKCKEIYRSVNSSQAPAQQPKRTRPDAIGVVIRENLFIELHASVCPSDKTSKKASIFMGGILFQSDPWKDACWWPEKGVDGYGKSDGVIRIVLMKGNNVVDRMAVSQDSVLDPKTLPKSAFPR